MIIMGIDPAWAKEIAWAIADSYNDKIIDYGTWPPGKDLKSSDIKLGADIIYIEGSYPKNFDIAQKLAFPVGGIIVTANQLGIPFRIVTHDEWALTYGLYQKMNRKARIFAFSNLAKSLVGRDLGEDLNVACLIALFGARQERVKEIMILKHI